MLHLDIPSFQLGAGVENNLSLWIGCLAITWLFILHRIIGCYENLWRTSNCNSGRNVNFIKILFKLICGQSQRYVLKYIFLSTRFVIISHNNQGRSVHRLIFVARIVCCQCPYFELQILIAWLRKSVWRGAAVGSTLGSVSSRSCFNTIIWNRWW